MSNDISCATQTGKQVNGRGSSYRKHYIPLESNPDLFTQLVHKLGVSQSLAFVDVLSIDDPDLLAFIPRPALALVLVFPTSDVYEDEIAKEDAIKEEYSGRGEEDDVIWFKQTINNACGLYGILHGVSNGEARNFIRESERSSDFSYISAHSVLVPIAFVPENAGRSIKKKKRL